MCNASLIHRMCYALLRLACLHDHFLFCFVLIQYGRGRAAGGWKRQKWVFGMLGVKKSDGKSQRPILRLVDRRTRQELVPLLCRHVKMGSYIISDEWRSYRVLNDLGFRHLTVNHSMWYMDPITGNHTQHIERAWRTVKEQVWRQRGNRTEELLSDHLNVIEWHEWIAKKYHSGPLGRILHDIAEMYKHLWNTYTVFH